ncbi:MAG: efflux transporter outer membrane subunit [Desulfobacterales bacterium]|nr:efflux transporter outer membrane subunit [Desulfobacterales bacterium]
MTNAPSCIPPGGRPGLRTAGIFLAGLLLLAGCAVGPDYQPPAPQVPDQWHAAIPPDSQWDAQRLAQWWQVLKDPMLTDLVHQAAVQNLDVHEALSRVREARHQRVISRAPLFPSLAATGSARRSDQGDAGSARMSELLGRGGGGVSEQYDLELDAGWELDLFGGTRRAVEASQADLEARVEDLRAVLVTLLAEVAVNYVDLRTYQARLAVAEGNVAAQQQTWELLTALTQAGGGDELAVAQARYNLESSRAKISDLAVGLEAALNRLAVLTGRQAGSLHAELSAVAPIPEADLSLAVGVPADTIRQRPDIRRAERELAAQTARIGEATADLYPQFTLSGSIGLESVSTGDLFSSASRVWSFGPAFSWPLFQAGAIRANIHVQEELQQQAFIRYEAAILTTLEEVENALVAYAQEQRKAENLQAAADAARLAEKLAKVQYVTGTTGFSEVLEAQRSLLSFEDQLATSRGAVLANLVRLYKALGGGWQPFSLENETPPAGEKKS